VVGISATVQRLVTSYHWPGNIRELENAIERAVVLGSTELILPADLPEALTNSDAATGPADATYHDAVKEARRMVVLRAIEQAGGSHNEAARLLGLHPNNLHRLIRNLDLREAVRKMTRQGVE
jgi:Nif-specific regulatory protein